MDFFFQCFRGPDALTGDRLKSTKDKTIIKTKLTPISLNDPAKIPDKSKSARIKNMTLHDIFDHIVGDDDGDDDDDDEIQGDASGIVIPTSKSLGNYSILIQTVSNQNSIMIRIVFAQRISKTARKL